MKHVKTVIVTNRHNSFLALTIKMYLRKQYGISCRIIIIDNEILDKQSIKINDIVIPITINSINACFNAKIQSCLVNPPKITDTLDNKVSCGKFIEKLNINIIPTFYNEKNDTINDLLNFIDYSNSNLFLIKPKNSFGARGINTITKNELINDYKNNRNIFNEFLIQKYLGKRTLYSVDCVSKDGRIIGFLINKGDAFYDKSDLVAFQSRLTNYKHEIVDSKDIFYRKILDATAKIVYETNYNGFMEVEFLADKNEDNLYFMEVNPRISGCVTYSNYLVYPVIDKVIIPYISEFTQDKQKLIDRIPQNQPKYVNHLSFNVFTVIIILFFLLLGLVLLGK
jgi:biotin carboxylase